MENVMTAAYDSVLAASGPFVATGVPSHGEGLDPASAAAAAAGTATACQCPVTHGPPGYSSLSLTHVLYPTGAVPSMLLAYVTLIPIGMIVAYVTLILSRPRTRVWQIMFLGQLLNEGLNVVLKKYIQEHRPSPYHGDGYGMPSSHAQFMAYFAAFSLLLIRLEQTRIHGIHRALHSFLQSSIIGVSALVMYSRVHLHYHTVTQVLAGAGVGLFVGSVYFVLACPEFPFGPRRRESLIHKPEEKVA
ncbi:phosphatidic acid phosphatase type 2/haloperoxidase [Catenaria anguillulae PL171]|uniref:Dolichyldiphosphatase n=1 Tax=Catenaria anguillulae PL171 TaxID=765915 RepID=A0A1Y2I5Z2_9FUNG|nr:phosphatidic acid phosphatase type 2/haloperoxidase [Catenaria anguillulae PL171]